MQDSFFEGHNQELRKRFFLIINPEAETINYKNRLFTSLDTYPTVLAAIGADIEDNRLGLGINLFSMKKTISEKHGFDYVNEEITKKSKFYNKIILGSDYVEMVEQIENNEDIEIEE